MDIKYLKQVALGFLSVLLVLSVFSYVIYHITNGFSAGLVTTPALMGEYYEEEQAHGYIFREEKTVSSNYSGTVSYSVSNGERVAAGTEVARVFDRAGDESLTAEMVEIDKKIQLLEASGISDNVSVSGTNTSDKEITECVNQIFSGRRGGNYSSAAAVSDRLLISMNRRELIVSGKGSYDGEIEKLNTRKRELSARLSGANEPLELDESGYFYYTCDGYESIFAPELLGELTPSGLDSLAGASADTQRYAGKYVTSPRWYLALTLDRTEISKYTEGKEYKISFEDYGELHISMTLDRINTEADRGLLVFSATEMPAGFAFERVQSVSIITAEHEGLRFPMSAVRLNEGVEGVFVLYGNTVFFRRASVIGQENGYAVVAIEEAAEGEAWSPLSLYDEVIISGTGLYHTMIVN